MTFRDRTPSPITVLHWLPEIPTWREQLSDLGSASNEAWEIAVRLSNARLNFLLTNALDRAVKGLFPSPPAGLVAKPLRLAMLGSSTLTHLHSAIRVGGMRRSIWIDIYESEYGQFLQELSNPGSGLYEFRPNAILLVLDAYHLTSGITSALTTSSAESALTDIKNSIVETWRLARRVFQCPIVHQTPLPLHLPLLGNNEHRLPGSKARLLEHLNHDLRAMAETEGVELLAIDSRAAFDGINNWHDRALWHRSKQEITPLAAPIYGDLVARIFAAKQGRSYKCLVMDLDNTLWGGTIGDDGMEGIVLGQGSALGEAFLAFQHYAAELAGRGIILAVCSKNDEANAIEPFDKHPEMALKRSDIACFVANWSDKATNLRRIARELNIGLDALVFIDDNPFERDLVRRELPMVAVPEVGDDPTDFPKAISDGGYFEGLMLTEEDRDRGKQYQSKKARDELLTSATDLESFLRALEMRLLWRRFDGVGLQRTVQLINKSNQFNLTTRRYTEEDVLAVMSDSTAFGLQFRLLDRYGDNGVIAIVIGRLRDKDDVYLDTWLMSCRVLGRQVELATLNVIAQEARRLGARRLIGEFIATTKNAMVRDHYDKLGFRRTPTDSPVGISSTMEIDNFEPRQTAMKIEEG
jgi:FkbH-like protein